MNTTTATPTIVEVHDLVNHNEEVRAFEVLFSNGTSTQISWEAFETASLLTGLTEDMFLEFPNMCIELINEAKKHNA